MMNWKNMFIRTFTILGGAGGMIVSGLLIWKIIDLLLQGAINQNVWLLAVGAILLYFFVGILCVGFIFSVYIFYLSLAGE